MRAQARGVEVRTSAGVGANALSHTLQSPSGNVAAKMWHQKRPAKAWIAAAHNGSWAGRARAAYGLVDPIADATANVRRYAGRLKPHCDSCATRGQKRHNLLRIHYSLLVS